MKTPENLFKAALARGEHQLGLWNSLGGSAITEQLASCGYDWVLIDAEHGIFETGDILPALQAVAAYPATTAIVRPPSGDAALIKRLLDFGAQSLLIPYVQTAEEARALVAATRYAPAGIRGFAGMTRASRFGKAEGYATNASDQICLLVQAETKTALDNLEEIASVDGVDGVFIGPADLAASLGHPGDPDHPEVQNAIADAFARLRRLGVPAGILALDPEFTRRSLALGSTFTAVGVDSLLLDSAAVQLEREARGWIAATPAP